MTKSLNKEVKRTCILIDSGKTNRKYIKGCVKMEILSSTHIKADCDIWNHFISLKVHVNIHKERGIFMKLSYCILKWKNSETDGIPFQDRLLNINLNAFLWTRGTSTPHNNGIRLDIVWFIIVICHVAMSKIRSEQVHNLLWKFLNSIARNVLSLVSFYYKKYKKYQFNLIQFCSVARCNYFFYWIQTIVLWPFH